MSERCRECGEEIEDLNIASPHGPDVINTRLCTGCGVFWGSGLNDPRFYRGETREQLEAGLRMLEEDDYKLYRPKEPEPEPERPRKTVRRRIYPKWESSHDSEPEREPSPSEIIAEMQREKRRGHKSSMACYGDDES